MKTLKQFIEKHNNYKPNTLQVWFGKYYAGIPITIAGLYFIYSIL
jgi:hypothetical protein